MKYLKNVKVDKGYCIDYVIYNNLDCRPIIYTRKIDEVPFRTLKEYEIKIKQLLNLTENNIEVDVDAYDHPYRYEKAIEINNNDGYFEYLIINIMGEQFYLGWHAKYNDWRIVCTKEKLNEILETYDDISENIKSNIDKLSIEPTFINGIDVIYINLCEFSQWGGLIRKKYEISKTAPHFYKEITSFRDTLISYKYNVVF